MSLIRFRRGRESNRGEVVPRLGEPLFTSDSNRLYVGDGVTPGGIPVGTGEAGKGVPPGGESGQVLEKRSSLAYDTRWATPAPAGVISVNGRGGEVTGLAEQSDLIAHEDDTSNPHSVTKGQVGLGNVPNTDFTTPVADATDKLATIEEGADVTDAANVNAAGATMNNDTTLVGNGYFLDEDDMASNSASKVPSQQSVKSYVDSKFGDTDWEDFSWFSTTYDKSARGYTPNKWRVKNGVLYILVGAMASSTISTTSEDELARIPIKNGIDTGSNSRVWNGAVGGGGAVYGMLVDQSANYMSVRLKPHTTANNHTADWFSTSFAIPLKDNFEIVE